MTAAVVVLSLLEWLKPDAILEWLGPWAVAGVAFIIFAECGLLLGFFLPGDSLLFITGLFVGTGAISEPLWLVCLVLGLSAFVGNLVGYWIGAAAGPRLFNKPESRFFKQEYVDRTHAFFERYGGPAIILGRFVPIVRTFITAIAGVGRMDFRKYVTYSLIGAVLWAVGVTVLGYFLGGFEVVNKNIEIVLVGIVALSVIPMVIEWWRHRKDRALVDGEG